MFTWLDRFKKIVADLIPMSFVCWKEKYTSSIVKDDLFAGITVGLIALPLSIAFAIGDRKSTRLNSSHIQKSRMPSSA